jgi:hypothetical protein
MIGPSLSKLLQISGPAMGPRAEFRGKDGLMGELLQLLSERNGFYAFESALLLRPGLSQIPELLDAKAWNKKDCWKYAYEFDLPPVFCFAEDVFGGQYSFLGNKVVYFDPESAETEIVAANLEEWATLILDDFNYRTGYPLARVWQKRHDPLPIGFRLVPKQAFVLGGAFTTENLKLMRDVEGMRVRGFLATHIRDLPDGGKITFVTED